jgi:hypothetical protein
VLSIQIVLEGIGKVRRVEPQIEKEITPDREGDYRSPAASETVCVVAHKVRASG